MTALAKALNDKGIVQINVDLQIAIAKFQNNGGQYGVALAMLDAAYGRGSVGRSISAHSGQRGVADASSPPLHPHDGEAGREANVLAARIKLPASPSAATDRRQGQSNPAERVARSEMPDRRSAPIPGHSRRGASAIAAASASVSASLFDRRLPDGRRIRDVAWAECPGLAKRWITSGRVLLAIHRHVVPVNPMTKLDTIVSEAELKNILDEQEKVNVAG